MRYRIANRTCTLCDHNDHNLLVPSRAVWNLAFTCDLEVNAASIIPVLTLIMVLEGLCVPQPHLLQKER